MERVATRRIGGTMNRVAGKRNSAAGFFTAFIVRTFRAGARNNLPG
jgi:hypothetical protein